MPKITIIGAGSMVFSKNIISDVLSYPEFSDATLSLMDIDEARLEQTTQAAKRMIEKADLEATVESTTDRATALTGADYVINMVNVGDEEPFVNEIRIPQEYGVNQAIGDTLGPGGVFRALRTIPVVLDIAADVERICPDAVFLNYTNPMATVCWAVDEATDVDVVGLCHSVPHTVESIADYVDASADELDYWVAGINHMAWFLTCRLDGESVYPHLESAMEDPEIYERDTVRFQMMKHFGYFATESSHHLSEYVPYFRTDEERIKELKGRDRAGRMETAAYLEGWIECSEERDETGEVFDDEDLVVERSDEYAARIIYALESGEPQRFNLNVMNDTGAIANLPEDACVEVPCLVDGTGIHPCTVGSLPPQLAALNRTNVNVQGLTVQAALEGDREAVFQAVKLDPLTGAVLSLDEIHAMTEELLEANREYLPELS